MSAKSGCSEEDARLDQAPRCAYQMLRAREIFIAGGVALAAGRTQELGGLDGKVLIELGARTPTPGGKGWTLLHRVGGIRQGSG